MFKAEFLVQFHSVSFTISSKSTISFKIMSIFQNMICGTSQMDAAVLVIAATDGVMAQTRVGAIVICRHAPE